MKTVMRWWSRLISPAAVGLETTACQCLDPWVAPSERFLLSVDDTSRHRQPTADMRRLLAEAQRPIRCFGDPQDIYLA